MSRRGGKRTATVLVLLVCGSVLVPIVNWKSLVTEYHVYRLRQDPDLLDAVMSNPEDRLQEAALYKYLQTSHGRLRLCKKFVDGLFAFLEPQDQDFLPRSMSTGQIVGFGLYRVGERPYFILDGPRTLAKPVGASPGVLRLEPFFRFIHHGEFELAEHPGIKLAIWAYADDLNQGEVVVEGRMVRADEISTTAHRSRDQQRGG